MATADKNKAQAAETAAAENVAAAAEQQTAEQQTAEQQTAGEPKDLAVVGPIAGIDFSDLGFSDEELKELTGLDTMGAGEVRIPYTTLIAKATRDHEVGDIVFPDGSVIKGAKGERLEDISILKMQPVRVMFPTPFNPNNDFICRSIDGLKGHTDGQYPGRACGGCEFAEYPTGGGASPCRDQRLLLLTLPGGGLSHTQIGGVGMGVWKDFLSAQMFHLLPKAKNILGLFKLSIGVKIVDTNYGPFPAIDFRVDPRDPYVSKARMEANLNGLRAYKEFEHKYAETAAAATKISMAAGQEEAAAAQGGANTQLF